MDVSNYNAYKADPGVIKLCESGGFMGYMENSKVVVSFIFYHKGFSYIWPEKYSDKRISLSSFPLEHYNKNLPFPPSFSEPVKILANADREEYAILYQLEVKSDKKVTLSIQEYPTLGTSIISKAERRGITLRPTNLKNINEYPFHFRNKGLSFDSPCSV